MNSMIFTNRQGKVAQAEGPLEIPPNVLSELSKEEFAKQLQENQGLFIIKFGAEWCGPCKRVDPLIYAYFAEIQRPQIQCAIIDIDESFEVYAFLKSKKMVKGIPAILVYKKGTLTYVPDDIVIGADVGEIDALFQRICKL
jgi:thioredoxin 1